MSARATPIELQDPLLGEVLAAMREAMVVTDRLGKIVCASHSVAVLVGRPEGLEGKLLAPVFSPDDQRAFRALVRDPAPPARELTVRTRAGTVVPVLVQATDAGRWIVWSLEESAVEDVRLDPSVDRLVQGLTDGVVAVDRRLRITLANRAATRLGGFRVGEQLPNRWGDFDLRTFAAALFNPSSLRAEAILRPTPYTVVVLNGMPTSGRARALLIINDASSRERRERREREFVANAAHELQTPLTAIVGAVDVLEGGAADDPTERARFITHLRRESDRLVRLVGSLLLLARATDPTGLRTATFSVRPLLNQVAREVRPQRDVRVEVLAPAGLRLVSNRELIEVALANLAHNAARHTTSGSILLSGRESMRGIAFEVRDSGVGMSPQDSDHATDRFYRGGDRVGEGFGLGLAIVQQVADALGGEFELRSTPGEGTVARLFVPRG